MLNVNREDISTLQNNFQTLSSQLNTSVASSTSYSPAIPAPAAITPTKAVTSISGVSNFYNNANTNNPNFSNLNTSLESFEGLTSYLTKLF